MKILNKMIPLSAGSMPVVILLLISISCNSSKDIKTQTIIWDSMVYVQKGSFIMGNDQRNIDERPAHPVEITYSFYIGKFEVTQKEFKILAGKNPSHFTGDDLPVDSVSFIDAVRFCNALSRAHHFPPAYNDDGECIDTEGNPTSDMSIVRGFRLPTEAEWEFAARGGIRSEGYQFSGSDDASEVAWTERNSGNTTHAIGTKKPNELGIYDMTGNVWEWCSDHYRAEYIEGKQVNPFIQDSAKIPNNRGGGWNTRPYHTTFRGAATPDGTEFGTSGTSNNSMGLRICLTLY